ncbi:probable serine/threonine-protein kinase SIS8 isoform X1 [Tanacetum coccineum]
MPSLVDLQKTPVSDNVTWEAVVVNKAADSKLLVLEQTALDMAVKSVSESVDGAGYNLVQRLAVLVSDHMGGPIGDPEKMLLDWREFSSRLKTTLGSVVFPLGLLKVGIACHRGLLFKVLADSVGIPCRLVKGKQYTGSNNAAMIFVKLGDGREYIVDLMADPGTLIPSDTATTGGSSIDYDESFSSSPWSRDDDFSRLASSRSGLTSSSVDYMEDNNNNGNVQYTHSSSLPRPIKDDLEPKKSLPIIPQKVHKEKKANSHFNHTRSPSWTEGISSPAVRKMKVKDVSQYMMEAAKENPQLAQKLHDVLLESGVVAPPDLFTEVYDEELPSKTIQSQPRFLPPLPQRTSSQSEVNPVQYTRNVPAAAAAAAAAAAVASSMVVAATRTITDQNMQLPVAAAATVTAAVVVATTTASVAKQYDITGPSQTGNYSLLDSPRRGDTEAQYQISLEGERVSDRSTGNESTLSEVSLEDVADCEIAWEDITLGERIGLGSYGEVYRGDWHGTDIAVKKFLDQEITTESLEEFRSENFFLDMDNQARGMNYLHNCSPVIVHRDLKSPNLLVDKNWVVKVCDFGLSRMKNSTFLSSRSTAGTVCLVEYTVDVANLTHLLMNGLMPSLSDHIDKIEVPFGTLDFQAEWMAPEVLRNEPSDEKCDVYSYGVVLWELCTMQQPWGGMNAMQVVGAVGFQHRRLEIPNDTDPVISDIITKCWQTDPKLRPTFAEIMAALKPLQKQNTNSKASRE